MITALILFAVILAILTIIALVMTGDMIIERSVIINKPLQQVFNYLKLMKNQDNFSVWNMADPNMKKTFMGTDGTVGCTYAWDSSTNKNVGAGEQEILKIEEWKTIEYEIRFKRPMQNVAKAKFAVTAVSADQTTVLWGFYSKSKFPVSIMKTVFQKMLGKDLQKSLGNLKTLLEK